ATGVGKRLKVPSGDATGLFGESHGLVLVAISDARRAEAEEQLDRVGVWWQKLGEVGGENLMIRSEAAVAVDVPVTELRAAWEGVMSEAPSQGGRSRVGLRPVRT